MDQTDGEESGCEEEKINEWLSTTFMSGKVLCLLGERDSFWLFKFISLPPVLLTAEDTVSPE